MTIRYKCDTCGSKLNIKDDLAGTQGKCPKCKTPFTVPQPETTASESSETSESKVKRQAGKQTAATSKASTDKKTRLSAKERITAKAAPVPSPGDDDFDPVAFLMEDEPSDPRQKSVSPLSDDEIPMDLELELSDDEAPRANRSRRRVDLDSDAEMQLGSAAESAGAMLTGGGSSSSAAKDLLTRTVEESRARATRIDDDEPKEPSAARELAYELATRGLPGFVSIVLIAGFLYYMMFGWMSGAEYPDLGRVTGVVTLDGQPLADARVTFRPIEKKTLITETRSIRLRPSKSFTNAEGYYDLRYDEDVRGAFIGEHVVQITKRDGPKELVPPGYSGIPQEKRSVAAGSQEINFAIESDAAQ